MPRSVPRGVTSRIPVLEAGVVRVPRPRDTDLFAGLGRSIEQATQERDAREARELDIQAGIEGSKEGATAFTGLQRDPSGRLAAIDLKPDDTIYNRNFNEGLLKLFSAALIGDATKTAGVFALNNRHNAEGFATAWEIYTTATVGDLSDDLAASTRVALDRIGSETELNIEATTRKVARDTLFSTWKRDVDRLEREIFDRASAGQDTSEQEENLSQILNAGANLYFDLINPEEVATLELGHEQTVAIGELSFRVGELASVGNYADAMALIEKVLADPESPFDTASDIATVRQQMRQKVTAFENNDTRKRTVLFNATAARLINEGRRLLVNNGHAAALEFVNTIHSRKDLIESRLTPIDLENLSNVVLSAVDRHNRHLLEVDANAKAEITREVFEYTVGLRIQLNDGIPVTEEQRARGHELMRLYPQHARTIDAVLDESAKTYDTITQTTLNKTEIARQVAEAIQLDTKMLTSGVTEQFINDEQDRFEKYSAAVAGMERGEIDEIPSELQRVMNTNLFHPDPDQAAAAVAFRLTLQQITRDLIPSNKKALESAYMIQDAGQLHNLFNFYAGLRENPGLEQLNDNAHAFMNALSFAITQGRPIAEAAENARRRIYDSAAPTDDEVLERMNRNEEEFFEVLRDGYVSNITPSVLGIGLPFLRQDVSGGGFEKELVITPSRRIFGLSIPPITVGSGFNIGGVDFPTIIGLLEEGYSLPIIGGTSQADLEIPPAMRNMLTARGLAHARHIPDLDQVVALATADVATIWNVSNFGSIGRDPVMTPYAVEHQFPQFSAATIAENLANTLQSYADDPRVGIELARINGVDTVRSGGVSLMAIMDTVHNPLGPAYQIQYEAVNSNGDVEIHTLLQPETGNILEWRPWGGGSATARDLLATVLAHESMLTGRQGTGVPEYGQIASRASQERGLFGEMVQGLEADVTRAFWRTRLSFVSDDVVVAEAAALDETGKFSRRNLFGDESAEVSAEIIIPEGTFQEGQQ